MLIVGLGNPGREYSETRHNAGFMLLDLWCEVHQTTMTQSKFSGLYGTFRTPKKTIHLLKPQTFMNLSGKSVQACMAFYRIPPEEVLVIHDELDLPVGDIRIKADGGHGGHNGLRSIIELTGKQNFGRLRFGIGRPPRGDAVNYVLGSFMQSELESLQRSFKIGVKTLDVYVSRGQTTSMNFCNGLYKAQKREERTSGQS